jgi:hypothetical protein
MAPNRLAKWRFVIGMLTISVGGTFAVAPRTNAQTPTTAARADGWVVIPVDEYRALRLKAFPPGRPPDPPPVDATLTRVEYDLRVNGESASGEARLTVDVLKEGWVRVDIPSGLVVRAARIDGRPVPIIDQPAPHVLVAKPGRAALSLDVVVPLRTTQGTESFTLPPSRAAVSRLAVIVARDQIDLTVNGAVLSERPQTADGRWIAFGRTGQPIVVQWQRRVDNVRASQPLRWRGTITQLIGLGEETSALNTTVRAEVVQGLAASLEVAIPEGVAVNQVSGPLVADWDFKPGVLRVNFLEPVAAETSFSITAEARTPRDGSVCVPLLRLPTAERESGGIAVEVLGAGEIGDRQPQALDPADPSELGEMLAGRESPSMVAFRFRPQRGQDARNLTVSVARYTPHAVLIANVEEARYDALLEEEGKVLVRARYALRNNQRAFLGVTLPPGATLWSAAVANRPLRPGTAPDGSLLLPLEKAGSGGEAPAFAVELTYVQRAGAWADKGRAVLTLPALDLPIARTGVVLHHSPRFQLTPEPGAFRLEIDSGPFAPILRSSAEALAAPPAPPQPAAEPAMNELVTRFRKQSGGRAVLGALPLRVPFPAFGPTVYLISELTAESQASSVELSYKRESRW